MSAASYAAGSLFGLALAWPIHFVAGVWPAAGIALTAALRWRSAWPGIALGSFVGDAVGTYAYGDPVRSLALFGTFSATGSALQATLLAGVLRRKTPNLFRSGAADEVVRFVIWSALLVPVASTFGITGLLLVGKLSAGEVPGAWLTWMLGDLAGILLFAPALLTLRQWRWHALSPRKAAEGLLLLSLTALLGVVAFNHEPAARAFPSGVLLYLCLPLLMWAALRFRQPGAAVLALLVAGIAIGFTRFGRGPFVGFRDVQTSLLLLQGFLEVFAITGLVLAATWDERSRALVEAREQRRRAERDAAFRSSQLEKLTAGVQELTRAGDEQAILDRLLRSAVELAGAGSGRIVPAKEFDAATGTDGGADLALPLVAHDGTLLAGLELRGCTTEPGNELYRRLQALAASGAGAIEQARLAEAERSVRAELEQEARRKDEFLALLGHELRNPLAAMSMAMRLLKADRASPRTQERAHEVLGRQLGHMEQIVNDLLDVSRLQHGKIRIAQQPLDLRPLVAAIVADHADDAAARAITLEALLGEAPVPVLGDATRLSQVTENLLGNALKFTPRGGRIWLEVEERGGQAELRVRDTGVGIDPAVLPRLFLPFAQAEASVGRGAGGLGLGLALSRGLIALHGGSIEASSDGPGRGSTFTVRLPLHHGAPEALHRPDVSPGGHGRRVLVIEDNPDVAESLAMVLELQGHRVTVAHSGDEGLRRAHELRPEVVLCDLGLPGRLDGFGVARAVRSDTELQTLRLVALTGFGDAEHRRRARESGFDQFLAKPPDMQTLAQAVAG